jgi:oligopeptide/dipeptide ABC transporter ATP-binding protein
MDSDEALLEVEHLKTSFFTLDGVVPAVDDVSFKLCRGETVGLVGESGCGKSVSALSVMRLIHDPPGRIVGGKIRFDRTDLLALPEGKMRALRGNRISMIFQEPMTSLNPVYTIGAQIAEVYMTHRRMNKTDALQATIGMLQKVQIPSPQKRISEYPHELSGGMRQRAMIAMALACNPDLLIADEPTTALDVTIQAQIIDLMLALKGDYNAAILIITHDLGVIAETAQRVVVMYAGQVVECGSTLDIFDTPLHPYTQGLLQSVPVIGRRAKFGRTRLQEIPGVVPSPYGLPPGCAFNPRCPHTLAICRQTPPPTVERSLTHHARCWLLERNQRP